jgi:hypothetical protein
VLRRGGAAAAAAGAGRPGPGDLPEPSGEYDGDHDAIIGGVLTPGPLGSPTLHAALLSDRLFESLFPVMFAKIERAFNMQIAPPEDVTAAATAATWHAVDYILVERMARHAAAAAKRSGSSIVGSDA